MLKVKRKSRIPHSESYPLRASELSAALCDVPQARYLQISFWRYVRMEDRFRITWPLIALTYSRFRMGISTPNYALTEGWLDPTWEIQISPTPGQMRHVINGLLLSEALPILERWLIEREALHGRFGHDWIRVLFNTETEKLQYQRP